MVPALRPRVPPQVEKVMSNPLKIKKMGPYHLDYDSFVFIKAMHRVTPDYKRQVLLPHDNVLNTVRFAVFYKQKWGK